MREIYWLARVFIHYFGTGVMNYLPFFSLIERYMCLWREIPGRPSNYRELNGRGNELLGTYVPHLIISVIFSLCGGGICAWITDSLLATLSHWFMTWELDFLSASWNLWDENELENSLLLSPGCWCMCRKRGNLEYLVSFPTSTLSSSCSFWLT